MKPNSIIHLTAFLTALQKLDEPLPSNLQIQLNEIAKSLKNNPDKIINLDIVAESYSPLNEAYQQELDTLDSQVGERSKRLEPEPLPTSPTSELTNAVINTFSSNDSVAAAKDNVNQTLLQRISNFISGKQTNE